MEAASNIAHARLPTLEDSVGGNDGRAEREAREKTTARTSLQKTSALCNRWRNPLYREIATYEASTMDGWNVPMSCVKPD